MGMQETRDMRLVRTTRGTAVAMAFLLGACAAQKQVPAPMMEPVWDGTEEVSDLLAESAQRAVSAHETLAMIERTRDQPAPSPLDETPLPPEMQRATSNAWRSEERRVGKGSVSTCRYRRSPYA